MFKSEELIFAKNSIYLKSTGKFVMMDWQTPILEKHVDIITRNGGDILEVGFGMGIVSNLIQSKNIKTHTIMENHPQIIKKVKIWMKDKNNVNLIEGDWVNRQHLLKDNFDGIFFDPCFDNSYKRFKDLVDKKKKKGTIFSYFDPYGIDVFKYGNELNKEIFNMNDVTVPKEAYYFSNDIKKAYICWVQF